jgi:hypothetical protein
MNIESCTRRAVLFLIALGLAFSCAGSVRASTFCVSPKQDADCQRTFPALQAALDAANPLSPEGGHIGFDKILIGRGEFSDGPFCYEAADPLEIAGEGSSDTVLTMDATTPSCLPGSQAAVLTLSNFGFEKAPHLEISNVGIRISSGVGLAGMMLEGAYTHDVDVGAEAGSSDPTGVITQGVDAGFSSGTIALPTSGSVGARTATTGSTQITRSRITAVTGVMSTGANSFVNSSLIRLADGAPAADTLCPGEQEPAQPVALLACGALPTQEAPKSLVLFVRDTTVYGTGKGDDIGVKLATAQNTAGVVDVIGTVLANVGTSLLRSANHGDATMNIGYSNHADLPPPDLSGSGEIVEGFRVAGDPGFVSPSTGDFHLRRESPLIDSGNPEPLAAFDSPVDLDGNPRILDGVLSPSVGCRPRRDVGAFEFVRSSLLVRFTVSDAVEDVPTLFDASGSCDPDPTSSLVYRWSFDDGGTATGLHVLHAFDTTGLHLATLDVTSSAGRSGRSAAHFLVQSSGHGDLSTFGSPKPNQVAAYHRRPSLRRLDVRPRVFRAAGAGASIARSAGAFVRYRLSEQASVRFTVLRRERRRHGEPRFVRLHGSFAHQGHKYSNKFHFSGRLAGRKLRSGRYRLVGIPVDASGSRGKPGRVSFRIVGR